MTDLKYELHKQMIQSVRNVIDDKKIGIAFSGGVDSSLLARICKHLGYDITLLTVGFTGSHDIEFSKQVSTMLGYKHRIGKISPKTFPQVVKKIKKIIKSDNLSWNENCIAFYHIAKLARRYHIRKIITANGIDELFCGYNGYRVAIEKGENEVMRLMKSKIKNEINMMEAVNTVVSEFEVEIVQPFLSKDFIDFAKKISVKEKIQGPDDLIRKHIVRELAFEIGVPKGASFKRKKALQYGTLIHKTLMKLK